MRFTLSKDGRPRASLKMEFRLSGPDLALFYVCRHMYDTPEDILAGARAKTQATVLEDVRDLLDREGTERPSYMIGDESLGPVVLQVQEIFTRRWGWPKTP